MRDWVSWVPCYKFNHISPTIDPRLIWNMSSESHLTSLSDGINFIFSRSKLMEKNPFPHGYHVGTMWLFGYNSTTAEPNSMRLEPLESYDLMLFYGMLKSRGTMV